MSRNRKPTKTLSERVGLLFTTDQPGLYQKMEFPSSQPLKLVVPKLKSPPVLFTPSKLEKFEFRGRLHEGQKETYEEGVEEIERWSFCWFYTTGTDANCRILDVEYHLLDLGNIRTFWPELCTKSPADMTAIELFYLIGLSVAQPPYMKEELPTVAVRKKGGVVTDSTLTYDFEHQTVEMHTPFRLTRWNVVDLQKLGV